MLDTISKSFCELASGVTNQVAGVALAANMAVTPVPDVQAGIVTAPNAPQVEMANMAMNYPTVNNASGATVDTSNVLQVSQSLQQAGVSYGAQVTMTHDNTQYTTQSQLDMQQPQPGMSNSMMG